MQQSELLARIEASRHEIKKLTIFRVPVDVLTLVAVTAATIESFPGVDRDEVVDAGTIDAALDAIVASRPIAREQPLDARFGLIFSAAGDRPILRVYKGAFASAGQIDDTPCTFEHTNFHEWLTARSAG